MIKTLHILIIFLWFFLSYTVGTFIILIFSLFPAVRQKVAQIVSKIWFKIMLRICGIRIKVIGAENIEKGRGLVFASNHESMMDIPILGAAIPINFRFLAKKELFKIPFFGLNMKLRGDIPIERDVRESAYKSLDAVVSLIDKGESIHIFPEGTRTKSGTLGQFKRGANIVAVRTGAPIIPISITGSFHILPKGSLFVNPTNVTVRIGTPVVFEKNENIESDLLLEQVQSVRNTIADMIRKDRETKEPL